MLRILTIIFISSLIFSFVLVEGPQPVHVPPSKQRTGGDAAKGYEYLVMGDYVRGGIPIQYYFFARGKKKKDFLQREGNNKDITHEFTAVKATNGEVLVAPNCLQCHAQVFEDTLIIGMGNSLADFTKSPASGFDLITQVMKLTAPKKYDAAENFLTVGKAIGPHITTSVKGVNSADRLAAVLAAHRDPVTFKWNDKPALEIPEEVIPSDVPAWWLLKKKNAMFHNGFGRGDYGRFLMASNLLTVSDTAESAQVDAHMPDVLAYIYTLEPPKYPGSIDSNLAAKGEEIFIEHCSGCHGTYGKEETYPNLLIPIETIKTDSLLYSSNYSNPQFINWFNNSWFTKGPHAARLEPFKGYMAPPLDGIWATAPYLHNGSVPTLEALLDSKLRPAFWFRDFIHPEYDHNKIGWKYEAREKPTNSSVYNTTLPGYSNQGHYFSDDLDQEEKIALREYLKSL